LRQPPFGAIADYPATVLIPDILETVNLKREAVEKHPLFSHLSIRYNKDRQNKRKRRGKCAM